MEQTKNKVADVMYQLQSLHRTLRPSATEFRKLRKNPAQTLIHCICNLADNFDNQDTTHDKAMLLFEEVCQVMISHYVSSEDLQEMLTEIIDNQEE